MDDTSGEVATAEPAAQAQSAPEFEAEEEEKVPDPVRVGWVAGENTLEKLSRILRPLGVGLMDEMVVLSALCPPRADASGLPSPPIEVIQYRRPRWWRSSPKAIDRLAQEIRKRDIQLLHALDGGVAGFTGRLAQSAGVPHVVSTYSLKDSLRGDDCAAILAGGEAIRRHLIQARAADPSKVRLLRPGVYQVHHPTCFINPGNTVAIVAGGPRDSWQPFLAVLRSFQQLGQLEDRCELFLLTSGRAERRLRAEASRLGLDGNVTFASGRPTSQLPGIFKAADVYISPAIINGVDIQSLLALAAGAVVVAAGGGGSEFLRDGETALLFDEGNAAQLTDRLTGLLDDRPATTVLVANALACLRTNHAPANMVTNLRDIYRQTISITQSDRFSRPEGPDRA